MDLSVPLGNQTSAPRHTNALSAGRGREVLASDRVCAQGMELGVPPIALDGLPSGNLLHRLLKMVIYRWSNDLPVIYRCYILKMVIYRWSTYKKMLFFLSNVSLPEGRMENPLNIWGVPQMVPHNGWLLRENPIQMDDLGVTLWLRKPPYPTHGYSLDWINGSSFIIPFIQWEFQDPKLEVLTKKRTYVWG